MSHAHTGEDQPWVMPGWMDPYLTTLDLGGYRVEDWMNHQTHPASRLMRPDRVAVVRAQVELLTALYGLGELGATRRAAEAEARIAAALRLTTSHLTGTYEQIAAHCARGDGPAVIFYSGASLALAHVGRLLRGATAAHIAAALIGSGLLADNGAPVHIRQLGAARHNLCPTPGGPAADPGAATCPECLAVYRALLSSIREDGS